MDKNLIDLYAKTAEVLTSSIDETFKRQLLNQFDRIETLDARWKTPVINIQAFLKDTCAKNKGMEEHLLLNNHFEFCDAAALCLELIWQGLHGKSEVELTINYYKLYKIQGELPSE